MRSEALPEIAAGTAQARPSGIREILDVAIDRPGCVRLEVGEPDFPTPAHVVEAAARFASTHRIGYTQSAGTARLREKITAKLRRVNHLEVAPEQINVTVGGAGAVAGALVATASTGDEVLIPDPAWPNYEMLLDCIEVGAVPYPCRQTAAFLPDPEEVEALVTPRTRALVINTPSNPTGAMMPRALVQDLVSVAERHNLWLISDECYDQIVFDQEHVGPASIAGLDRVISVFTFSKTYAMTGWRIGYAVANEGITHAINRFLEASNSCVSAVSQAAAEAALDGPQTVVDEMVAAYGRRRNLALELLRAHDLVLVPPSGAFYVMARAQVPGWTARELALDLVANHGLAVAPGTAFGKVAQSAVRLSLASSEADLRAGIDKLAQRLHDLNQI